MLRPRSYICQYCEGVLHAYDKRKRIVRQVDGSKSYIYVVRFRCELCRRVQTCLPHDLVPCKQYTRAVIFAAVHDELYDEYPSDSSVKRWLKIQSVLW